MNGPAPNLERGKLLKIIEKQKCRRCWKKEKEKQTKNKQNTEQNKHLNWTKLWTKQETLLKIESYQFKWEVTHKHEHFFYRYLLSDQAEKKATLLDYIMNL